MAHQGGCGGRAGVLIRVLQPFQLRNIVPCRVSAARVPVRGRSIEILEIEIEVVEPTLAPEAFRLIVAKIAELPMILTAVLTDKIAPSSAAFYQTGADPYPP